MSSRVGSGNGNYKARVQVGPNRVQGLRWISPLTLSPSYHPPYSKKMKSEITSKENATQRRQPRVFLSRPARCMQANTAGLEWVEWQEAYGRWPANHKVDVAMCPFLELCEKDAPFLKETCFHRCTSLVNIAYFSLVSICWA
jgi:hypothetical protein